MFSQFNQRWDGAVERLAAVPDAGLTANEIAALGLAKELLDQSVGNAGVYDFADAMEEYTAKPTCTDGSGAVDQALRDLEEQSREVLAGGMVEVEGFRERVRNGITWPAGLGRSGLAIASDAEESGSWWAGLMDGTGAVPPWALPLGTSVLTYLGLTWRRHRRRVRAEAEAAFAAAGILDDAIDLTSAFVKQSGSGVRELPAVGKKLPAVKLRVWNPKMVARGTAMAKAGKFLGPINTVANGVEVVHGVAPMATELMQGKPVSTSSVDTAATAGLRLVGSVAGGYAGAALVGAVVGSALGPAGTIVGSVAGAMVGEWVANTAAPHLISAVRSLF